MAELSDSLKGGVLTGPIKGFGLLSDSARKHASIHTGLVGEKRSWSRLHPALAHVGEEYVDDARELAWVADRILRRHGKKIVAQQPALKRVADVLVHLFALACVLSRMNAAVEGKGEEDAGRELAILQAFHHRVRAECRANFALVDENEDERLHALAADACDREGFGWDVL